MKYGFAGRGRVAGVGRLWRAGIERVERRALTAR